MKCTICNGKGKLRRGEPCLLCNGLGSRQNLAVQEPGLHERQMVGLIVGVIISVLVSVLIAWGSLNAAMQDNIDAKSRNIFAAFAILSFLPGGLVGCFFSALISKDNQSALSHFGFPATAALVASILIFLYGTVAAF